MRFTIKKQLKNTQHTHKLKVTQTFRTISTNAALVLEGPISWDLKEKKVIFDGWCGR